jgi:hypothetical protein
MLGIAYCGIDCDTCEYLGKLHELAEQAAELHKGLKEINVSMWGPSVLDGGSDVDFQGIEDSLGWLADSLTCPGCKGGGGLQGCSVRQCSREKGFDNCSQCTGLMECSKFDHLTEPDKIKERLLELRGHA